ncbi:MAG: nucleoside hydrolase [Clostridiales Family XIII bacterium]|jgi:inosine-uridine nucleoside N-ribohydrolase|nr:nucleoside hydrolase [Clostridiales Family XIII bacterium]
MDRIIIDCDPGHDDAIAILLAVRNGVASGKLDIRGITTVAGNSEVDNTTRNALKVLNFAGIHDIPVYKGCAKPMMRELYYMTGAIIHGEDGLGGPSISAPTQAQEKEHAVEYLTKALRPNGSADKTVVVATGPLTNIAAALTLAPEIIEGIEKFVIMGGAVIEPGNITSAAEYNIYVDPEAAKAVFNSGVPIYLHSLDVTMKALIFEPDIIELMESDNPLQKLIGDLLMFFAGTHEQHFGIKACPIHDALCIASLLEPDIVKYRHVHCDVSVNDELTRGETVADLWGITGKEPNVHLASEVDSDAFISMIKGIK